MTASTTSSGNLITNAINAIEHLVAGGSSVPQQGSILIKASEAGSGGAGFIQPGGPNIQVVGGSQGVLGTGGTTYVTPAGVTPSSVIPINSISYGGTIQGEASQFAGETLAAQQQASTGGNIAVQQQASTGGSAASSLSSYLASRQGGISSASMAMRRIS